MPNVEIDVTNSTVKTDVLTSQSGTAITVPTGKVLTVTDAAGLTVAGTAVTPASYLSAIPDNSVTGGKLNISLLAGDTMYASATDTLAKLAKGTAAQVLTMNAGATAPEWADAAGGGAWTILKHDTWSTGVSVIEYSSTYITSTYKNYVWVYSMVPSGNDNMFMQMSTDNGSSYATSSSDYQWIIQNRKTQASGNSAENINASENYGSIEISYWYDTGSGQTTRGRVWIHDPMDAATKTTMSWEAVNWASGTAFIQDQTGAANRHTAEANNAIKMYWSGNAPGYATLYGIAHA